MGHYKNDKGIDCFEPDNTEKELWIETTWSDITLQDIAEQAMSHFGKPLTLSNIVISPEYVHTSCIYYDMHDPSDWTHYLKITLNDA